MSDTYWDGFMAALNGKDRECLNPWNVKCLQEWLKGYDDAKRDGCADKRPA